MPLIQPGQSGWVGGAGPLDCKIAIVGEAPGATEVKETRQFHEPRPFVGDAGRLLDECLQNARIVRRTCYITNLFKVQISKAGNNFKIDNETVYVKDKGVQAAGLPWVNRLKDELEECKANVIVALGEPAINALTGLVKPVTVRGSIVPSTLLPGRKVICAIHPAASIRGEWLYRYMIAADLRKAAAQSEFPEIREPERDFILNPSFEQVMGYLETIRDEEATQVIDIETYNCEPSVLGLGRALKGIVIPFMYGAKHRWTLEEEAAIWKLYAEWAGSKYSKKILQNAPFDLWVLFRNVGIITLGPIRDTMVAMGQLYPDFAKSLQMISSLFTTTPYYKDELKIWTSAMLAKAGGTVQDQMQTLWEYNKKDVHCTDESWLDLREELKSRGQYEFPFLHTMRLMPPVIYMESRGLNTSRAAIKEEISRSETEEAELRTKLYDIVGYELNPNSPQQLKDYFYTQKGIPPYYTRPGRGKKPKPTCNDNALKRLSRATTTRPAYEEAKLIRRIKKASKLRSSFLEAKLDPKSERLVYAINPVGTKNGRFSTKSTLFGFGMNVQNLPQQFKRFVLADPGALLWEVDKRQGEWVISAYMARDPNMIEVAESGVDAHTATAKLAFGVPEELILAENKVASHETNPINLRKLREQFVPEILKYRIPTVMTCRQAGKKSNHGLNYDMGYKRFAYENEIPENEAKPIVEAYHHAYPGIRGNFHADVVNQLKQNRTLENPFGRKRWFLERWGDTLFKAGYDFGPQSTLVDLVNIGLIKIYEEADGIKHRCMYPLEVLDQVHDSLFGQYWVRLQYYLMMARAMIRVADHMDSEITVHGRTFRIDNELKVGLNWAGYHEEHNPLGMMEVELSDNELELAERLWDAHSVLLENQRNI